MAKYRIKELREQKGITQAKLAELSGVSRLTIVALENNEKHEALVGTINAIAKALEVPVSELFAENV